jgi:hypothetical protein
LRYSKYTRYLKKASKTCPASRKKRSLIVRRHLSLLGPPLGRVILADLDGLLMTLVDHTSSLCAGVVRSLALVRTAVSMSANSRKHITS